MCLLHNIIYIKCVITKILFIIICSGAGMAGGFGGFLTPFFLDGGSPSFSTPPFVWDMYKKINANNICWVAVKRDFSLSKS